jgi:hypothetical protein
VKQKGAVEQRICLNPLSALENFKKALRAKIYVDKSGMLSYLNGVANTTDGFVCVSRPRRFGKTWAVTMAASYYSKEFKTRNLFKGLRVSDDPSFDEHLNEYNVIYLNIQDFLSVPGVNGMVRVKGAQEMVANIINAIFNDLKKAFPVPDLVDEGDLVKTLYNIKLSAGTDFVFLIDEWDCIFRVLKNDIEGQKTYLDFLRHLFKDRSYVCLAYMTGILPIKKYGTHSALNMFNEFSMSDPANLAEFAGFTESEAKGLFERAGMSFEQAREWYDGYVFDGLHIYSPLSVVRSVTRKSFKNYWNQTETHDELKMPISLNFDGLKDSVLKLLSDVPVMVNVEKFQNDMSSFSSADDVLTLLVHLGYLAFDSRKSEAAIPNRELRAEFKNALEDANWAGVSKLLQASNQLLRDTWALNPSKIENAIQEAHNDHSSVLKYNDENSLCSVISIAYYAAYEYYIVLRELASGKGYIDLLYLPKPMHFDKPALLVELKSDKTAKGAIEQIKEKNYTEKIQQYTGDIILVGINYDKETKTHSCAIEKYSKW